MANYLCVFPAPDSHIEFIQRHSESLWAYLDGERFSLSVAQPRKPTWWQRISGNLPQPEPPPAIPPDWPTTGPTMIGPEITARNVDLYHLILNGTTDFVQGSGTIFQTWLEGPRDATHTAIDLTGDGEQFAFKSSQIPELVSLLSQVGIEQVRSGYTQWLRERGDHHQVRDAECNDMAEEFRSFTAAVRDAVDKSLGLIWFSA